MAHLFDRLIAFNTLFKGGKIGYFSGDVTRLTEAMNVIKPTYIVLMPRLLSRFYTVMAPMLDSDSDVKQILLNWKDNPHQNIFEDDENFVHELYNNDIFVKFRSICGGNLKTILTGGAPSSPDVLYFIRVALSVKLIEMYGQTEAITLLQSDPMDSDPGYVGPIYPVHEFKLVDVPEMNYTSKDMINGVSVPRGEI